MMYCKTQSNTTYIDKATCFDYKNNYVVMMYCKTQSNTTYIDKATCFDYKKQLRGFIIDMFTEIQLPNYYGLM
jgi:hypothetical protein